jgi:flavin-dependent dehydrogenase
VALVDKASFPRDKACGDMVGPRGVQLLADLGLPMPDGPHVGDMLVVGPTGRRVRMPSAEGLTYPGHGIAVARTFFDTMLRDAAMEAGVTTVRGRAVAPLGVAGGMDGYRLESGDEVHADFVVGADGATSGVAQAAGLVEAGRVLWGFAIRTYLAQEVDLAAIVMWEPTPWRAFPGYGWVFPAMDGGANVGLGIATRGDRRAGARAARSLPGFLGHLHAVGLLDGAAPEVLARRLGGWLKMGMVGTTPAAGRVLLVGDAAGLINPLQGEGIAQGMRSGQLAAETLLAGPGRAAERYTAALVSEHLPYQRITAALQSALVGRPWAVAAVARSLTAVAGGDALAGGWAVFWNELLEGAPPGRHRSVASALTRFGEMLTSRTAVARWFDPLLSGGLVAGPG